MRIIDSSRAAVVAVLSLACACGGGGGGPANQAPVAAITAPAASTTAFVGAAVTFTGTCTDPDGDTVTGAWAFPGSDLAGAGVTGLGPVDAKYAAAGSYQATLTCTDSKGLTGTAARAVTIETSSVVALRAEAPDLIRAGSEWGYAVVVHAVNGSNTNVPQAGLPVTVAVQGVASGLSGTTTVNTDADGVAVFPAVAFTDTAVGARTLEFTSPALTTATATIEVKAAGGYNITLRWLAGDTLARRKAFDQARLRWETVISGDQPNANLSQSAGSACDNRVVNEVVDDLLIYADVAPIDGTGKILGSANPCLARPLASGSLPVVGSMQFDSADIDSMETSGSLRSVVMHEMGHVLGFGTLWNYGPFALLKGETGAEPYFNGAYGKTLFASQNNGAFFTGTPVPVEGTGGTGTAYSHWRETVFGRELMTGWISGTSQPMSATTIGSLEDMGYAVDTSVADAFDIASPGLRSLEAGPVFDLTDDVLPGPIEQVDDSAQLTP